MTYSGTPPIPPRPPQPRLRQTHTVVELDLPPEVYDYIAQRLRDAGYDHLFLQEGTDILIDMSGIGIVPDRDATPQHPIRQRITAEFLQRTGKYVTNDATREAAIAEAIAADRAARLQRAPLSLDYIEKHIGADEGDRDAVVALVRETEAAHGITAGTWDASHIKKPDWQHVGQAFVDGARESRQNPEATEDDFKRTADGYTKRVFEEVDPVSEAALRTGSWQSSPVYTTAFPGLSSKEIEDLWRELFQSKYQLRVDYQLFASRLIDKAFAKAGVRLAHPSTERLQKIWQDLGGAEGFCKTFGFIQYAREVEKEIWGEQE